MKPVGSRDTSPEGARGAAGPDIGGRGPEKPRFFGEGGLGQTPLDELVYDENGLLPVVVQDVASGAVLMLAWADREAVERTLATGQACFWSRSRRAPWRKGETSGHVLEVVEVRADCDRDALLVRADPRGPTCHRGTRSCFDPATPRLELGWLWRVIEERAAAADPAASYTARLLAGGAERAAQKVGEEATETVIAALAAAGASAGPGAGDDAGDDRAEAARRALAAEAADLLYHLLVLLAAAGGDPGAVAEELRARHTIDRSGRRSRIEESSSEEGEV